MLGGDGQDRAGGDGGVDRVAPLAQRGDTGRRGEVVDGAHEPPPRLERRRGRAEVAQVATPRRSSTGARACSSGMTSSANRRMLGSATSTGMPP